jgi:uncharacterized protein
MIVGEMIIEGLVTSTSVDGTPHVAPMGPLVDRELRNWLLRPFQTTTTFANLRREGTAVFHVIDDVLPVVQAALNFPIDLEFSQSDHGGWIINSACHWYCLSMLEWNIEQPRAEVRAEVVAAAVLRPFWGWNRAKHAVLEATILATRLHLRNPDQIAAELSDLLKCVEKTGGRRERIAWDLVTEFIRNWKG